MVDRDPSPAYHAPWLTAKGIIWPIAAKCSHCGESADDYVFYCPSCGRPLPRRPQSIRLLFYVMAIETVFGLLAVAVLRIGGYGR